MNPLAEQTVKTLERSKQRAESLLRAILQTIPDLVWLKDEAGVYLACNRMFERLYGMAEADIVGKTDYDFVDRELADSFREHDLMAMQADKIDITERWITFADDGHRIYVETLKSAMYDDKGNLIGVLGIARDMTCRYRPHQPSYPALCRVEPVQSGHRACNLRTRIVCANLPGCRALRRHENGVDRHAGRCKRANQTCGLLR
jgi:PAS domain S-box-containing protein